MTMNPGPSIEEYVDTIAKVMGIKIWILSIPIKLLLVASYFIDLFARPLGIEHPCSPVGIKKLTRSNNILPTYLCDNRYKYRYTLEEALLDWKNDCPEEWS